MNESDRVLDAIRDLAPLAVEKMRGILQDPKSSHYAKIQVITLILNRTYGMPEASVKVNGGQESMEESIIRIRDMVKDLEEPHK